MTASDATPVPARPGALQWTAVLRGAGLALAIVVVAGAAQVALRDTPLRWALWLVILAGFAVGGARAATTVLDGRTGDGDDHGSPARPYAHAAMAALVAFGAAQGAVSALRLAQGRPVAWLGLAFLAMLATSSGLLGAGWMLRRRSETGQAGGFGT